MIDLEKAGELADRLLGLIYPDPIYCICCGNIIDETRINGSNYILVADAPEGDAECMILKDVAPDDSKESIYEEIEDDNELDIGAVVMGNTGIFGGKTTGGNGRER